MSVTKIVTYKAREANISVLFVRYVEKQPGVLVDGG